MDGRALSATPWWTRSSRSSWVTWPRVSSEGSKQATWRLLCVSFLLMPCFLLRTLIYYPNRNYIGVSRQAQCSGARPYHCFFQAAKSVKTRRASSLASRVACFDTPRLHAVYPSDSVLVWACSSGRAQGALSVARAQSPSMHGHLGDSDDDLPLTLPKRLF